MQREGQASNGQIESRGAVLLYFQWNPAAQPLGAVVLVHGFGEHSGRYGALSDWLNASGYDVLRFDCRGHGQSGGRRGHVHAFAEYVDDLDAAVGKALAMGGDQPMYLLGHSLGAVIVAAYVLQNPEGLDGLILSSPAMRLALPVHPIKALAGRIASRLWPTLSLPTGIDPKNLSHVKDVVREYQEDPRIHHEATARWYTELLKTQKDVLRRAGHIELPTLVLQAGADRLVDAQTSHAFYQALKTTDKQWLDYEGFFHEVFNETEHQTVFDDVAHWLIEHRG